MYKNKKILVCGMARSGIAVSKLLKGKGAIVTLYDKKSIDYNNSNIKELIDFNIELISLDTPIKIINEFDIIVVSPGIPLFLDFILKAYELKIPVVSEIEICNSLTNNKIIGITGTNGKTTCTTLIGEILSATDNNVQLVGNIGIPFSEKLRYEENNTVYVAELSSYQLESTYNIKPKVAIIINLSHDHLERHKTYQNYIDAKKRIYMNQSSEDFLVLNYDDKICKGMAKETKSKILFFSKEVHLKEGVFVKNNKIYIRYSDEEIFVLDLSKIKLLGKHNVENILAAISALYCFNVNIKTMREIIYGFTGVEHRLEIVRKLNGITYINDSKSTNESSTISAIKSFSKNIILILGGNGNEMISDKLYNLINDKVKHVFLIGESKDVISKGFISKGFSKFDILNNLDEISFKCKDICSNGDILLFSPGYKSFDMFINYEDRGNKFKEVIKNLGA